MSPSKPDAPSYNPPTSLAANGGKYLLVCAQEPGLVIRLNKDTKSGDPVTFQDIGTLVTPPGNLIYARVTVAIDGDKNVRFTVDQADTEDTLSIGTGSVGGQQQGLVWKLTAAPFESAPATDPTDNDKKNVVPSEWNFRNDGGYWTYDKTSKTIQFNANIEKSDKRNNWKLISA